MTNGQVYTVASANGVTYLGGVFDQVGPYTGNGVPVDATSGLAASVYPRVNNNVLCVVADGSGGWFIGGGFTQVGSVPRNGLAHILSDGSVDPSWDPNANSSVNAMVLNGSTLYVGGRFGSVGRQTRHRIAALDVTSGNATTWDPSASNGNVNALLLNGTTMYVGGDFSNIGGQSRSCIAALDTTTGKATAWNPNATASMNSPYVQTLATDGKLIYAGGYFEAIGGGVHQSVAAVDATTGNATTWHPNISASDYVNTLALHGSTLFAGGFFIEAGINFIAGIDTTTALSGGWNPRADGVVNSLIINGSTMYVGGAFTTIGGQPRNHVAALDLGTGNATGWNPNASADVYALVVNGNTIYVGGAFSGLGGQARKNLAAVDATGVATSWNPGAGSVVHSILATANNIYVGGEFTTAGGQNRNYIAALDPTTGAATTWDPQADNYVFALATDGNVIYAGGSFGRIGTAFRQNLAAVDTSGAATGFNPAPINEVRVLAFKRGLLWAGGAFTAFGIDSSLHNFIAAIDPASGVPTAWDPMIWSAPGAEVFALEINGSTVAFGGNFNKVSAAGTPRLSIAAVDATTAKLSTWDPEANGAVYKIVSNGDTVYVGGNFTSIGNASRNYLAALDATTGLSNSWNPSANSAVRTLTIDNTSISVGGYFTAIAGENRKGFAQFTIPPPPPTITGDPVNLTIWLLQNATFTVTATGTNPLSYQWQKSTDGGTTWISITGATAATYIFTPVAGDNGAKFKCVVSNGGGSTTSGVATLTVNLPPSITVQPGDQTIWFAQNATFTVTATGTNPLSYQWKKSTDGGTTWASITGATSATYIFTPVAADSGSKFRCTVSNTGGSVNSNTATLTVNLPPTITGQPADLTIWLLQNATFTVTAAGTNPLSYQWQKSTDGGASWAVIGSATSSTYIFTPVAGDSGSKFRCAVSNGGGTRTSNAATLTVNLPPTITQPQDATVLAGASAVFSLTANGTPTLTYQWQLSTDGGTVWANISNATSNSYTFPNAQVPDSGKKFRCVVSYGGGSVTSRAALLTVTTVIVPPSITTPPSDQIVIRGQTATFSVTAGGTQPLNYQWKRSNDGGTTWTDISGASAATYTTANTVAGDNGAKFKCTVANSTGSATSSAALLTVNIPPTITTHPSDKSILADQDATFSVTATGSTPMNYQWQLSTDGGTIWADISGATANSTMLVDAQLDDSGKKFRCVVTNSAGNATSNAALLTVSEMPIVTKPPTDQFVTVGDPVGFSVTVTGSAPLSYKWQHSTDGATWSDASGSNTSSSYTIDSAALADAGWYQCVIINSLGSATSSAARLTVTTSPVPPSITTNPENVSIVVNSRAVFNINATGSMPLSYQWERSNDAGTTWTPISGATISGYIISSVVLADNGARFHCVVKNKAGTATSNAALLTVTATAVAPTITEQPLDQTVAAGDSMVLSVSATGTDTLLYQWQKSVDHGVNWTPLITSPDRHYAQPVTNADNGNQFRCLVKNDGGQAISNTVTLHVAGLGGAASNTGSATIAYPNPFDRQKSNTLHIRGPANATVDFFNTAGEKVHTVTLDSSGDGSWNIAGDNIASGLYVFRVTSNGSIQTGAVAIQ